MSMNHIVSDIGGTPDFEAEPAEPSAINVWWKQRRA